MNILINASGSKVGGGVQVADSFCRELYKFSQHKFVVILSSKLNDTADYICQFDNIVVKQYDVDARNVKTLLTGRDVFLDNAVKENEINVVLTIFGPCIWVPKVPHLCGFARPHLVLPESPYFSRMGILRKFVERIHISILSFYFARSTKIFYTENKFITQRLKKKIKKSSVHTVTNYYNQVFDHKEMWKEKKLPVFEGTTLLCVTAAYPHKNLSIAIDICRILIKEKPDFKFRFVFTIDESDYPRLDEELQKHILLIGRSHISECPSLYSQSDIMFLPSLLECFSATYPEAMKMRKPIVTTDLEFAKGLCGDAACYYSAVDPKSAAEAIYKVATDKEYAQRLIEKGEKQLRHYDNYEQRAEKLIGILEQIGKA